MISEHGGYFFFIFWGVECLGCFSEVCTEISWRMVFWIFHHFCLFCYVVYTLIFLILTWFFLCLLGDLIFDLSECPYCLSCPIPFLSCLCRLTVRDEEEGIRCSCSFFLGCLFSLCAPCVPLASCVSLALCVPFSLGCFFLRCSLFFLHKVLLFPFSPAPCKRF